jgi:hypothetical protein
LVDFGDRLARHRLDRLERLPGAFRVALVLETPHLGMDQDDVDCVPGRVVEVTGDSGAFLGGSIRSDGTAVWGLGNLASGARRTVRKALARIDRHCRREYDDNGFADLSPATQDEVLSALAEGEVDLGLARGEYGFTSADFFTQTDLGAQIRGKEPQFAKIGPHHRRA